MSRHTVTVTFELDILDEEAAIALVAEGVRLGGGPLAPGTKTAEESVRKHPAVIPNALGANLVSLGARSLPWVRVGMVSFGKD